MVYYNKLYYNMLHYKHILVYESSTRAAADSSSESLQKSSIKHPASHKSSIWGLSLTRIKQIITNRYHLLLCGGVDTGFHVIITVQLTLILLLIVINTKNKQVIMINHSNNNQSSRQAFTGDAAACDEQLHMAKMSNIINQATSFNMLTSAPAELGGKIRSVSRNQARTQVLLQAQKLHVYGSGTFGSF